MKSIKITEVGPRDGLQNESLYFSLRDKTNLIKKLYQSGLKHIEVGSFVSPSWVPAMRDSNKVATNVIKSYARNKKNFSALVPNLKGLNYAMESGLQEVAVFVSATESFSKKNINSSIKESMIHATEISKICKKNKIKLRSYVSVSFGCPYEGEVSVSKVISLIKKLLAIGVYEVSVGDTIGIANPLQVKRLIKKIKTSKVPLKKISMHFHNTRGMALANVLASLEYGVTAFDSSVGGLGGCPYAKGATGNLPTEDLVFMLEKMGYRTGVRLKPLIKTTHWLEKKLNKKLPSFIVHAEK